ncbi:CHCH domain containing protein [Brugia malayi]|uniref:Bm4130 n=1 Tax=Brugia malayi TaxID=6279 RepID=A0A0I9N7I0_BRUMA|nr:CHCH domain containing protein [Brugia malayi]CTP80687.1 Bm4130 [Brugia malayi]VIO95603.1 CHCH domain containing protein [Brugia malayi]
MIIKLSHVKAFMLPVGLVSVVISSLAYDNWKKKQPPKPIPIQSLDRFEKMMESMNGSMMRPKTNN